MKRDERYGVAILGSGLAGLALCRQLLLNGYSGRILLLDNKSQVPGNQQKVGESLVQVGGYYFSKVLDLEEYLYRNHFLKYNLRFYWKTSEGSSSFEHYSQSFIRVFSNVCSYQLDRNRLEEHLLRTNRESPNVEFRDAISSLQVGLGQDSPHQIRFKREGEQHTALADWVVDTTGRGQFLKRKQKLDSESPIRNGSSWCWVEGLVDIEKLTDLSQKEIRTKRDRQRQGMIPLWLATNHFMGEGFWFWVIPLQGLTSLGLVYDRELVDADLVSTPEKLIEWACREFPLFERDLPKRKLLGGARLRSYSYDCRQTISPSKWAMSGMSGRFTDPLYSPGSDLIAYYNTLIADAILEPDPEELQRKCELYEALMRVVYEAYVPSYAISYDALGDQEVFTMKYSWELAIYFSFYVFPFINDLFTNARFIRCFFRKFAQLGPINRNLQEVLSAYYQWRKEHRSGHAAKVLNDFTELTPLKKAETAFYEVGITATQAEEVLDDHLRNLKEFARFILAYISSAVLSEPAALMNRSFVESIKLKSYRFDPEAIRKAYRKHSQSPDQYDWALDPEAMERFRTAAEKMAGMSA